MTVMITEVWDALKSAGAADDAHRRAAEAVADYRAGFTERVEAGFAEAARRDGALWQEMKDEVANVREEMRDRRANVRVEIARRDGEFRLLKWMMGSLIALNSAVLLRLLFV